MSLSPSDMGRGAGEFPHTTWGLITNVKARGPDRQQGFEDLCGRYWKPIYCYLRQVLGKSNEDAKDMAQAFFLWLVEGDVLGRYDPQQAGFRSYLKGLLHNFARDHRKALEALKRGGGVRHLAMVGDLMSLADAIPDARQQSPEEAFDQAWVEAILQEGLEQTRVHCRAKGKELQLSVYEAYALGPPGSQPTYAEVAAQFQLKVSDVQNHLRALRQILRAEIRAQLSQTVANPKQLQQEWSMFFDE